MKANTVATSTFHGGSISKFNLDTSIGLLVSPQEMLKRLIPYANNNKQIKYHKQIQHSVSLPTTMKNEILSNVEKLQSQLNNIHAEIIQSENLINVRNSLYGQLDLLREERQQIESDIKFLQSQFSSVNEVKMIKKQNQGYQEMNERLRRRMNEVKQYIHKMDLENKKIQENISFNTKFKTQNNYKTQINSSSWIENFSLRQSDRGKGKVDELIKRLHAKQQEAMDRVRRQQEQMNRRNQLTKASLSPNRGANTQFASRSYYPSTPVDLTGRRRFYSPQYRY